MKKLLFLTMALISVMFAGVYANDISIEINGSILETDNEPKIIEGRTMVPVRAIFEGVGAEVDWDADTKTITGSMADTYVVMTVDSNSITINGNTDSMDTSPVIIDGRAYAPARYVAESFGYNVEWDSSTKTVNITSARGDETAAQTEAAAELTTEITTEAATEAATDMLLKDDAKVYEPGYYEAGEIAPGNYTIIADSQKLGKYDSIYVASNIVRDPEYQYIEYSRDISINNEISVLIEDCILVEEKYIEKLDISRNGSFKVGRDIPKGVYIAKLNSDYTYGMCGEEELSVYDKKETTVYLEKVDDFYKYGVDLYDRSGNLIAECKRVIPKAADNIETLNMSDVNQNIRKKIYDDLYEITDSMTVANKDSEKYTEEFKNSIVEPWKAMAENDAEKKYVEYGEKLYDLYILNNSPNIVTTNGASGITTVNSITMESEKDSLTKHKNNSNKHNKALFEAESFEECEIIEYEAACESYV